MELEAKIELKRKSGRALYIDKENFFYIADGYSIYVSKDNGNTWQFSAKIPYDGVLSFAAGSNITARLTRIQIQSLVITNKRTKVVSAKDGIYRAVEESKIFNKSFPITRESRPLNLCYNGNHILFGEYGSNKARHEIHIYGSDDDGQNFYPAYTFKPGDIRHIHNIKYDEYLDKYWAFTGDYGNEPGIGLLDKDLKTFTWKKRGDQKYRVVDALINKDYLIYGTDTEKEKNYIIRLDKQSGEISLLKEIEGSSLYAARFGDLSVITTMVEPSDVNSSMRSYIYYSRNNEDWKPLVSFEKDRWHTRYFQYGNITLPQSESLKPGFIFSGQALRKIDNKILHVQFT